MKSKLINHSRDLLVSSFDNNLKEAILAFFQNLNSKETLRSYKGDILSFQNFLRENHKGIHLLDVRQFHITNYKQYLLSNGGKSRNGASSKTIRRKLACLSSFFEHLIESNLISKNPVKKVKRPKISNVQHAQELNELEVEDLLIQIDKTKSSGLLHFAICKTLFTRGLRRNELITLKIEDFKYIDDCFTLAYIRKGGDKSPKKIPEETAIAILNWLDWCKENNYSMKEDDYLFRPTRNNRNQLTLNKKLNPNSIVYIIKKYAKLAGIEKNVSPHSARASLICKYLDKYSPYIVQREVDHSDVSTTIGYDNRRRNLRDSIIE